MSAQPDDAPSLPPAAAKGRWLIVVLLVALASHACVFFFFVYDERSNDEKEYLSLGIALSDTGALRSPTGEFAKRMPLFPVLIAAVDRWQGREVLDSGIIEAQSILSMFATIFIALIARRLSDPRGAIVAGLIAALYAPFRYLQSVYLTETLVITLLMAAILLYLVALESDRPARRWAAWCGTAVLLGLGALTRADAGVFALPFALHAAWRSGPSVKGILRAVILLLGVGMAAIGWGDRNSRVIGAWTLSTSGGLNFYLGNNLDYSKRPGMDQADYGAFDRLRRKGLSEVEADRRLYAMGRTFIAAHPADWALNILRKFRVWAGTSVTWTPPGTLLIVAWTLALAGRRTPYHRWLLTAAIVLSIVWLAVFWRLMRPWSHPMFVFPLGLAGLFYFDDRLKVRGLLIGLIAAQLAVALAFIPLERLRWTVDGILIVALAATVSRICDRLHTLDAIFRTGTETPSN
ncbi:MAG TPA: glycosyltransferase family 39 protein [Phycisphaerae bacterium]|nr:glycosyltransferase family 39 protein [Phycisphaerae bacterium]